MLGCVVLQGPRMGCTNCDDMISNIKKQFGVEESSCRHLITKNSCHLDIEDNFDALKDCTKVLVIYFGGQSDKVVLMFGKRTYLTMDQILNLLKEKFEKYLMVTDRPEPSTEIIFCEPHELLTNDHVIKFVKD
jgi:hypothetical protein